jgi:hypothetical protein
VTVTTVGGTSATSPADQFSFVPAPVVSAVAPNEGPATGGTTVSITGTALTGASAVRFGAANASSFTVNSPTSITAVAPAGTGTVDVTVTTVGGTSATSPADQFSFVPAPVVSAVAPNDGPATGGTSVSITGANFTGATAVRFGTANASSFTVNSPTSITASSPPASGGILDVTVTTVGGASSMSAVDQFTYLEGPEYGRCVKIRGGKYETGACTKVGKMGFEWYPAFGGPKPLALRHFTTNIKELTTMTLESTTAGKIVSCKGETGSGEYVSDQAVAGVVFRFTGCEDAGVKCSSAGGGEGEIATNGLGGALGVILTSTEGPLKNKIGTDLKPSPGGAIAEFSCGSFSVRLRGAMIVPLSANAMHTTGSLKFSSARGVQNPSHFEGKPKEVPELSINGGPFRLAGMTLSALQVSEEKIEVSSSE